MKKILLGAALSVLALAFAAAEPVIDGKVAAGEYSHSKSIIHGSATLSWELDAQGGLSVAVSAKTKGWVGVGFGSEKMNGAYIYFGFVDDTGKAVFSEQSGSGHRHSDSGKVTADKKVVTQTGDTTVIEFHVPAADLPFTGTTVPFIAAMGQTADMKAYHSGNRDVGSISLN